jgi:hypothetical protein
MHDVKTPMAVEPLQKGVIVDDLGESVLAGLGRPIGRKQAWKAFPTFFWGILTLGFGPLIFWQKRFSEFAVLEQQQLAHLATWIGLHGDPRDAEELQADASRAEPKSIFTVLIVICLSALVWLTWDWSAHTHNHVTWQILFDYIVRSRRASIARTGFPYRQWEAGLAIGYALHLIRVRVHAQAVQRFVERFNQVLVRRNLPTIKPVMPAFVPSLAWWIGGAVCLYLWAWWGIVMMLAGWTQRYVIRVCSTENRAQLAWRLRSMMQAESPGIEVPMPIYLQTRCDNPICQAQLKSAAQFCPRCGRRIGRRQAV